MFTNKNNKNIPYFKCFIDNSDFLAKLKFNFNTQYCRSYFGMIEKPYSFDFVLSIYYHNMFDTQEDALQFSNINYKTVCRY